MLISRLRAKGKASEHKPCKNHVSLTIIDPEAVEDEALAQQLLEEAGVEGPDVRVLHRTSSGRADEVKGVVIESKAGPRGDPRPHRHRLHRATPTSPSRAGSGVPQGRRRRAACSRRH